MCIKIIYFLPPPPLFFFWNYISDKCDSLNSKDLNKTKGQFDHDCNMTENTLSDFLFISTKEVFIIPLLLWIMKIIFASLYAAGNFHHSSFILNYENPLCWLLCRKAEHVYEDTHWHRKLKYVSLQRRIMDAEAKGLTSLIETLTSSHRN